MTNLQPTHHTNHVASRPATPAKARIPFHRPSLGDDEIASVVQTLESGWLNMPSR